MPTGLAFPPAIADEPAKLSDCPRYLRLLPNLIAIRFSLMKLLPAQALVAAAPQDAPLIETSSGTMGIALATVAAFRQRSLTLVTPRLDPHTRGWLLALGRTRLIEVDGDQRNRLAQLHEALADDARLHWVNQYGDSRVAESYAPVGEALAALGVDTLVAPVGSGGSARGLIGALRRSRPHASLIAVDAINSVLFGRADGVRRTPGIGNSMRPEQMDHQLFDQVHWMSDPLMGAQARAVARDSGLFVGPTGAAALAAGRWHAAHEHSRLVAAVIPDEGHRYLESAFRHEDLVSASPIETTLADAMAYPAPDDDQQLWLTAKWNKKKLNHQ